MEEKLRIYHTGNAGVLFLIGNHGVGIDVFGKDEEHLYPDTPQAVKRKLWEKIGRKEIQTLVFTHGHGDHFHLPDVREALRRNPELQIISTEEVVGRIREEAGGKLFAVSVREPSFYYIEAEGFSLSLFSSTHMGEQFAGVQNLVVLLEAAGRRFFVPGDAWPKEELFERVGTWSREIDVMAAPFPLIGIPSTRRMLDKNLKLRHILALHLPRPEKDVQGWVKSAKQVCMRAKDGLPAPEFAEIPGKEYDFWQQ